MIKSHSITTNKETAEVILLAEIKGKEWINEQDIAFKNIVLTIEVPGFRKGHVPEGVAKRHISNGKIWDKAINSIIKKIGAEVFNLAKKGHKLASPQPHLEISKISDSELTLKFIYDAFPIIKLCDFSKINIKKPELEVSDFQIEAALKEAQKNLSMAKKVDRPAQKGDEIVIDFVGYKNNKAFEGGTNKDFKFELGSGRLIADLENGLIGLKEGEEKSIDAIFPKDYPTPELRDVKVRFDVKMKEVSEISIPEINDELAIELAIDGVDSLTKLRKHYSKEIKKENDKKAESFLEKELLKYVIEHSSVPIRPHIIQKEIQEEKRRFEETLKEQSISIDDYINYSGISKETMDKQYEDNARSRIQEAFILQEIAHLQNFQVTNKDYEKQYEFIANLYKLPLDQIKKYFNKEQLTTPILSKKALDYLKTFIKKVKTEKPSLKKEEILNKETTKIVHSEKPISKNTKSNEEKKRKISVSKTPHKVASSKANVIDKKVSTSKPKK